MSRRRWLLLLFTLAVAVLAYGPLMGKGNAAPSYYLVLDLNDVSYLFAMDYVASLIPEESMPVAYRMWAEADIQYIGNGDWEIKAEWQDVSGTWRLTQEPPRGLNVGTYDEGAREIEDTLFQPLWYSPTGSREHGPASLQEGAEPQRQGVLQCYQAEWEAVQPASRRDLRVFGSDDNAYLKGEADTICHEAGVPAEGIEVRPRE